MSANGRVDRGRADEQQLPKDAFEASASNPWFCSLVQGYRIPLARNCHPNAHPNNACYDHRHHAEYKQQLRSLGPDWVFWAADDVMKFGHDGLLFNVDFRRRRFDSINEARLPYVTS